MFLPLALVGKAIAFVFIVGLLVIVGFITLLGKIFGGGD